MFEVFHPEKSAKLVNKCFKILTAYKIFYISLSYNICFFGSGLDYNLSDQNLDH